MKIAIMGFGTVGSGAYEIAKAAGIEVVRILARHGRDGYEYLSNIITPDISDITSDPEIDLVVESMGGIHPAREYVLECLNAGKHVVTPNKNLISAYFGELTKAASDNNVELRFTATAGGGIPWLFNLQRTTRCDAIESIRGIVNGTCNYILDAMYDQGADFSEMLSNAQALGYAEADPSADIEGTDTLRKTVISANLAFGTVISEDDVPCFGIDTISAADVAWLKDKGLACRLMMNANQSNDEDGKLVSAYVEPVAFPSNSLEANVKVNNNLITLTGESIGTQSFYGQGAGMLATGESVIQDAIDIRDGVKMNTILKSDTVARVNNSAAAHRYYLRTGEGGTAEFKITEVIAVTEMHKFANKLKNEGKPVFFAAISE